MGGMRGEGAELGGRATDAVLPGGLVTFVFTDIESSTALHEQLGDAYVGLQEQHHRTLREVFSRHEGVEVKDTGDGLFVAFADPKQAVHGCLEAQRALSSLRWDAPFPLRVRMGVHMGPANPSNGDYVALAVNQAARVCAAAHGGQILLSADVVAVLEGSHASLELGRFLLRGFARPVSLSQLQAEGLPSDFPRPQARPFVPHNLPAARTAFFGRTVERDALVRSLGRSRLVTLTGPGGAGKTRLVNETAAAMVELFPDGAWRVPLATIGAPELLVGAVGASLDLRLEGDDASAVAGALQTRELLLILDNCEHLIGPVADLADAILSMAPSVRILATSREPLGVEGEAVLRIGPLSEAAAVELVLDRIASARPDHLPDHAGVLSLVRRLEGIPLALELAAARTAVLTLPEILKGLDDPLRVLAVTRRGENQRHGSLRAVLDWSVALLTPPERTLLSRMAVLAGPVSVQTVERVCGTLGAVGVEEDLLRLVDKSLVVAERWRGATSYRLLEPVRAYAQEQLEQANELALARRRLLDWAVELAEGYHERRGDLELLRERVTSEHAALLDALITPVHDEEADVARLRLAGAMARRWALDRPAEGLALVEAALQSAPHAPPAVRLRALSGLSRVQDMLTNYATALQREAEALELASAVGPSPDLVWSLATMATHLAFVGRNDEASERLREASALADQLGDEWLHALVRRREAYILRERDDLAGALAVAREDLAHAERTSDREALLSALIEVAITVNFEGDGEAGMAHGERALELARSLGFARSECLALTIVQLGATLAGHLERAAEATAEALALARSHGLNGLARDALDFAAVLLTRLGRDLDAAIAHGGAAAHLRDSTNPPADRAIADAAERLGEAEFARGFARGAAMSSDELDRHLLAAIAGAGAYADAAQRATRSLRAQRG